MAVEHTDETKTVVCDECGHEHEVSTATSRLTCEGENCETDIWVLSAAGDPTGGDE